MVKDKAIMEKKVFHVNDNYYIFDDKDKKIKRLIINDDQNIPLDDFEQLVEIFAEYIEVDPATILPSTDEEREELKNILEEAQANGEIDLSQFCVPMGA